MSLVGFKAKNHPQQATRDDVDDRRTPVEFFSELNARHGFTVDAAASAANAMLPLYWTIADNALGLSWGGHRVWCNPPYSGLEAWVAKAWAAMRSEGCELVVMLLPANRTEQGFWQRHIEPFRDEVMRRSVFGGVRLRTRFLPGRMRFEWPASREVPAKGDRPPFGCVLLTWERVA